MYLCSQLNDSREESHEECREVDHLHAVGEHGEHPGEREGQSHVREGLAPTVLYD